MYYRNLFRVKIFFTAVRTNIKDKSDNAEEPIDDIPEDSVVPVTTERNQGP